MSKPISVPPPAGWISHDDKPLPHICDCEFTDDVGDEHEDKGQGWHYDRKCRHCGNQWRGLHCPHDGSQNPCGKCGMRPTPVRDTSEIYPPLTANGYPRPADPEADAEFDRLSAMLLPDYFRPIKPSDLIGPKGDTDA